MRTSVLALRGRQLLGVLKPSQSSCREKQLEEGGEAPIGAAEGKGENSFGS